MPELPEVATFQQFAEQAALHRTILRVGVLEPRVVIGSPEELQVRIGGQQIVGTDRIGKQLFLKLESGEYITVHFGMTGSWRLFREEELPKYIKVYFVLDDGLTLGFRCPRILGRIGITTSVEEFRKDKKLGKDGLQISQSEFIASFNNKKGLIKPLLMNQRYVAGLGNWIVDEMLYQASVHPERVANTLTTAEFELLYDKMLEILNLAIKEEADYKRFPDSYLVTYRWHDREGHPFRKHDIQIKKVGGRTTYIDINNQKP